MTGGSLTEFDAEPDTGGADYFSAILAMQNASQQSSILPEPLLELISSVKSVVQNEGINCSWTKPILMSAPELAAYGATQNILLFHRHFEKAQTLMALDQSAVVGLATLLLGGKPKPMPIKARPVETQIVCGFAKLLSDDFKQIEVPQTSIVWQDYAGAKLSFSQENESPFLVLMINRRSENTPTHQPQKPNLQQQNYVRQAIGSSVLNVDYVLQGGAVSLAQLRNLAPGSVLPLASLSDHSLEARANHKAVFSGVLTLTAEHMAMSVTRVLTEGRHA